MKFKSYLLVFLLPPLATSGEMYRSPTPGDQGTYFVVDSTKGDDGIITATTSRVGKGGAYTDFTKVKVDCIKKMFLGIAELSEDGAIESPSKPLVDYNKSDWTSLVAGSSKSDLVVYLCNKHR
ncbi:hypothetical protein ACV1D9_22525 [Aeromonas allosaccharophila]